MMNVLKSIVLFSVGKKNKSIIKEHLILIIVKILFLISFHWTGTLDFRTPEKILFFSSDAWYTTKGFLLSLRQVPCSEIVAGETAGRINDASVCDREFEAVNFDLRSELYPLNYPPSLNCRYVCISYTYIYFG